MKNTILILSILMHHLSFGQSAESAASTMLNPRKPPTVITVGGENADIQGFTNEAIQRAIDALPAEGGEVKMSPGLFKIKAPVKLVSNMKLSGSGDKTLLQRIDGYRSRFVVDADFGELKIEVENASGFEAGMSFQIKDDTNAECWDVTTGVITDIVGNTLYIDTHLIRDYDAEQNGIVTNAGSCVLAYGIENALMSHFKIEGNKEKNDLLDGCNGGGIAILRSKNVTVDDVQVNNFNGEGITWQITEHIAIRNSEIANCTNMGLHPGTGSPNSVIVNNNTHHNKIGLFLCWRVQHTVVENNSIHHNQEFGISTGHKDSDVVFESNHIYENGMHGVCFRDEDAKNSPHRTSLVKNTIENNGTAKGGYGILIEGRSKDVVLEGNIIRDNKNGTQKAAIFIGANAPPVKEQKNTMSGHSLGNIIRAKLPVISNQ
jgi:hypothetical protein